MRKSKEMLKLIISNQELIMKALKIEVPVKEEKKELRPDVTKKADVNGPVKKAGVKKPVKKAVKRK